MTDEHKLIRQKELGLQAKRLKEDELLNAVFEGLKRQYMNEWAQTDAGDAVGREHKYALMHGLLDVRAQLNAILSDGNLAAVFLEDFRRKQAA